MTNQNNSDAPSTNATGQPPRQPPVPPPAPLEGALPDDGKGKADNTKNEADELAREFRVAEKWVIGTNITLAIIGIAALCIYHGQLDVMRGQLGEIIRQFPEMQKSANANVKAADQTEKAVNNAADDFRLDQRAWVGVDFSKLTGEWSADKKQITFTADATLKNTGKTPALHVSIFRGISIIKPWNESLNYDKEWAENLAEKEQNDRQVMKGIAELEANTKGTPREGVGEVLAYYAGTSSSRWKSHGLVMSPGAAHPLLFLVDKTLPDPNQDPRYRGPIPQVIYWFGRITYMDIFNSKLHTTKICLRFAANNLELCPDGGNSMD